ncbi:MAG: hypothetical protein QOJ54_3008 [Aliidongia sp.]|jgi:hypothetical protein|nr:hypothetical protein [Aliidongia sp.]
MRRHIAALAWIGAACCVLLAGAAESPIPVAVFDIALIDTTPGQSTPAERDRARALGRQLREAFARSGRYRLVDLTPETAALDLRRCNGCELSAAREAGARRTVIAWVHKVSNLILNINLEIDDAATGARIRAGSVDIRGNTDESWDRGLRYLLENQILTDESGKSD